MTGKERLGFRMDDSSIAYGAALLAQEAELATLGLDSEAVRDDIYLMNSSFTLQFYSCSYFISCYRSHIAGPQRVLLYDW